jgi:ATP-binding cassette subfamily B protein
VEARAISGGLALDHVCFTFGRGEPVLDDVSLEVSPGEVLAIVGASGSGKSTIVDLLTRHLDPDSGSIRLDGIDLRRFRLADVRRHVTAVEHAPFVFNTSLADNIRYACPEARDDQVEAAARRAGLDEFLASLPQGMDTPVGERGQALSAGQRQRLGIARALLRNPRVLVLDEATAALDPETEQRVVSGYESLMEGRTTILVSHRLDLARRADRVVVLDRGRVAQEGTPGELMDRPGAFRRLFVASGPS